MTSFRADNADYEAWLRGQCAVVERDLQLKHRKMRKDAFSFLRATYFRWSRRIVEVCPELTGAPEVLAVGDSHLENFGAWRDSEGRWVWGVNDFDEASVMPYALDLVRLAASVRLARSPVGNRQAAKAILDGYAEGLARPRPTLLEEGQPELSAFVACGDQERQEFWAELQALAVVVPPPPVRRCIKNSLPAAGPIRFAARVAGCGSLGRPRYAGLAEWRGGPVAREAKALVPSAWDWAHGRPSSSRLMEAATGPYRAPDPFLSVGDGFVVRRMAPDSRKIELGRSAGGGLTTGLLKAMGLDLGAIHAADKGRLRAVRADLEGRPPDWLSQAAKAAAQAVEADRREWRG